MKSNKTTVNTEPKKSKPKKIKTLPNKAIRKKNERQLLKGYTCSCCKGFYDALGLSEKAKQNLINYASRHRYSCTPPSSPEGFWNLNF